MMPQDIRAKIVRLRAMSAAEIFYRLFRAVRGKMARCVEQRGAASIDHFVARLAGDAAHPAKKIDLLFDHFRNKKLFAWQMAPDQCRGLYDEHFSAHRQCTIRDADRAVRHEFTLFDRTIVFAGDIDWQYDPLQEKTIPLRCWRAMEYYGDSVREVKYIWELNRCQHFVTLGKAYFLTRDEAYAEALCRQWQAWIERNPCTMGLNWTSALECALRIISWTWALAFIQQSDRLHAALYARILQSVWQHASFVKGHLSRFSSANNHLIGEALGLIYAGFYSELREAGRWQDHGFRILFRELLSQVHADGVAKEQTTHYQRYLFDFAVLAIGAAEQAQRPVPTRVMERVEKMVDFFLALCDENGAVPRIGDEDGGEALRLVEAEESPCQRLLSTAAVLFGRPDCKLRSRGFSEATLWLLGEDGVRRYQRSPAEEVTHRLQVFQRGGYVVLALQKPAAARMVFDCGPLGYGKMAAHGHADALSVTLSVHGREALIDSGTFLYVGAGPERDYYRSTRAHNTVTIDRLNQSTPLGPFQWGRRANCTLEHVRELPDCLSVQAGHDGYRRLRARHTRQIELRDDRWIVIDMISGLGYHKIDAYFHLAPCHVEQRGRTVVAEFTAFSLEFECVRAADADDIWVETAWHSPAFGQRERHPVLRRQVSGILPLHFETVMRLYE